MMRPGRRAFLVLALLVAGTACASSGPGGGTGRFPVFLRGEDVPCDYRVTLDLTRGYVLRAPGRPFTRPMRESEARWQLARWLSRAFTPEMPDHERPDAIVDVVWEYEREREADGRAGDPTLVTGYLGKFVEFTPQSCADEVLRGGRTAG